MSKENVIGNDEMMKWGKNLQPGNKSCFINWEAVEELPPQFETVITTIRYKKENDFADIGNKKFMPNPDLLYKIAEACGISGCGDSLSEPIFADININPMYCKTLLDEPVYRNLQIGTKVTKRSQRLQEDGTFTYSSACTQEYNVWNRCMEDWSKEEKWTQGYTLPAKFGKYKYQSPYNRQAQFYAELKFASAKAETKAHGKTIRELASLPTGFDSADLTGVLMFSKVRKSRKAMQAEMAAHLTALEKGTGKKAIADNVGLLFGEPAVKEVVAEVIVERTLLEVLKDYAAILPVDGNLNKMIDWLTTVGDNATVGDNNTFYLKAVNKLKDIESKIEEDQKIPHGEF